MLHYAYRGLIFRGLRIQFLETKAWNTIHIKALHTKQREIRTPLLCFTKRRDKVLFVLSMAERANLIIITTWKWRELVEHIFFSYRVTHKHERNSTNTHYWGRGWVLPLDIISCRWGWDGWRTDISAVISVHRDPSLIIAASHTHFPF